MVAVGRDITQRKRAEAALRRLTQRLVTAQEEERRRLSRDLHDEAGQTLTTLMISLEVIKADLPPEANSVRQRLGQAIALIDATMQRIRLLAHNLRPPALDAVGLDRTLEGLCHDFAERTELSIRYAGARLPALPDPVSISLYRFLQQALTNVVKHADASQVQVALRYDGETIELSVEDDGRGFDPSAAFADPDHPDSLGLLGMQERLKLLDGQLQVAAQPRRGTRLLARIPWTRAK